MIGLLVGWLVVFLARRGLRVRAHQAAEVWRGLSKEGEVVFCLDLIVVLSSIGSLVVSMIC